MATKQVNSEIAAVRQSARSYLRAVLVSEHGEHHFYVTSSANWAADEDLGQALERLRQEDRRCTHVIPTRVAVYRVPCRADEPYEIRNYKPMVQGAVHLCTFAYPDAL